VQAFWLATCQPLDHHLGCSTLGDSVMHHPNERQRTHIVAGGRKTRSKKALVWSGTLITAFISAIAIGLGTDASSKIAGAFESSSDPALSVNVQPDPSLLVGHAWALPRDFPISKVPAYFAGVSKWGPTPAARPAGAMALKVSVTAQRSGGITITGIEAKVIKHSRTPHDILADSPGQGGGISHNTAIGLNLDTANPSASLFRDGLVGDAADSLVGSYFTKYSIDLPNGATHVFEIAAYAQKGYDAWNLKIDYIAGGKPGIATVDNSGKPFWLVGLSGHTRFAAIYLPGFLAIPPDNKVKWARIGTHMCPAFPYAGPC
jgi:hypothetical protein